MAAKKKVDKPLILLVKEDFLFDISIPDDLQAKSKWLKKHFIYAE